MSSHKLIERICWICTALTLIVTVLFMNGAALGIQSAEHIMGYEQLLFDTSRVHTIDIVMDGWDSFIETCENEEYAVCSAVIDGEACKNIGIRAKGNTSLSSVSSMNSDRYSFKIEFDQYESAKNYHGLDKLSLNNIIQDNTFMKDFLVYEMMRKAGAAAPLCSFAYLTVNGEDWGLYLAVEAVEDSFLQRNYGNDHGELYKPDSMSFGGGRGNGKDFDMADFESMREQLEEQIESGEIQLPEGVELPEDFKMPDMDNMNGFPFGGQMGGQAPGEMPEGGFGGRGQGGFRPGEDTSGGNTGFQKPDRGNMGDMGDMGGRGGNMGSADVRLQYIDDDPESYPNIFDSAKTDITAADKTRLIAALKDLSRQDAANSVDIDAVLRYFVVHNFVVNGDSYTGNMIHNYYLYEEDGILSMLPWDYNLAFGSFQNSSAASAVNDPIDLSGMEDRPMAYWIFADEKYTQMYHQYFDQFLASAAESGWLDSLIGSTAELIAPYVEKDPSKFCTYEEFLTGTDALREFCALRTESVRGQLNGAIPSTAAGQSADTSALVDPGSLDLSDMGSMNMGRGGFGGENFGKENWNRGEISDTPAPDAEGTAPPAGGTFEETMAPENTFPGGMMTPPGGQTGGAPPQGMTPPGGMGGMGFPR